MMSIISRPSVDIPRTFSITISGGGSSHACSASQTERTAREHILTYLSDMRRPLPSRRDQPLHGGVATYTSGRRSPTIRRMSTGSIFSMSTTTATLRFRR
jgi:hypothetical protein